jgi:aryl-alcohol dehydrogenase-like predicted oxidoreductase
MEQVRLGSTGLRVSRICLGMMSFGTGGARADRRGHQDQHVEDAVAAADLTLTADERARVEAPYRPHPVTT